MHDPRRRSLRRISTGPAAPGRVLLLVLGLACLVPTTPARAQRAVDLSTGWWAVPGRDPTFYSAALWRRIWGPFGYRLRGFALVDPDSAGTSLYGASPELTLLRRLGGPRLAVFALGGPGLALETGPSTDVAAVWNAGLGLELNGPAGFSATVEARRFVEDRGFRGFWDLGPDDRRGWLVSVGFAFHWGAGPSDRPTGTPIRAPRASSGSSRGSAGAPYASDGPGGAIPDHDAVPAAEDLAAPIVETALAAMGEPYRWGGTSTDEGFDCSGLVWYAYRSHGVDIPRVSRDQARAGRPVPAQIGRLASGDILLFSDRPGVVTHVGLYIGDGRFIHATSSGGVQVGALDDPGDPNDLWWRRRWVGARRILHGR